MGNSEIQQTIKNFKDEMFDLNKRIEQYIINIYHNYYINKMQDFTYLINIIKNKIHYFMSSEIEHIDKKYKYSKNPTEQKIQNLFKNEICKLNNLIQNSYQLEVSPEHIFNSDYRKILIKNYINYINDSFGSMINEIDKNVNDVLENRNLNSVKIIPQNNETNNNVEQNLCKNNYFVSGEIQNKYVEIITEFETNSMNYINDNDKQENKSIAEFLKNAANIIRKSYNDSHDFLKILYKEYNSQLNKIKEKFEISSIDFFKKEFSIWVKNNNKIVESNLEKFLKNKNPIIKKNYLDKLYKDLLILYFQAQIAFPPFEINFDLEQNDFNPKTMIDYFNTEIKKKKVNFVILPSLFSNGNYIRNGQQWVFTYCNNDKKKTFFFENLKLENLIEEEKKFKIPDLQDRLELKVFLEPTLNYNISDGIKLEYTFYLRNKKTKKIEQIKTDSKIELKEDQEFINCEVKIMDNISLSYIDKQKDNKNN